MLQENLVIIFQELCHFQLITCVDTESFSRYLVLQAGASTSQNTRSKQSEDRGGGTKWKRMKDEVSSCRVDLGENAVVQNPCKSLVEVLVTGKNPIQEILK